MKLIVGLGNPGRRYERTPHNIGFDVVDILAHRHGATWQLAARFEAALAEATIFGKHVTLMKPLTYMNLSGRAILGYLSKNGGEPHEIMVICDDVNLPLGQLRLRPSGSHGGHKGLLSIIHTLGTLEFPRLRLGVRPAELPTNGWIEYVLTPFTPEAWETISRAEQEAADAVEIVLERGLDAAMNRFNRRHREAAEPEESQE
ncbi:MAG: aminoacyl-tRNA hydrolase [Candidatus Sumerlaeaceae bacterium]|nr:aminoacyl-tRNA hydrolase [Candidatus Sumerlaeaceae bacterium]